MSNFDKAGLAAIAVGVPAANAQRRGGGAAVKKLLTKIKDSSDTVRTQAWQSAGKVGASAIKPLVEVMADEDMEVARAAKHALWQIVHYMGRPDAGRGKGAVIRQLTAILEDTESPHAKREVMWMLSEIAGPQVIEPVARKLTCEKCREDARMVLERIGGNKAKAALQEAMKEAPEDFKANLAQSLRKLGAKVKGYPCQKLKPTKQTKVQPVE